MCKRPVPCRGTHTGGSLCESQADLRTPVAGEIRSSAKRSAGALPSMPMCRPEVIAFVFPGPKLSDDVVPGREGRATVEFVLVGAMTALNLPIGSWAPRARRHFTVGGRGAAADPRTGDPAGPEEQRFDVRRCAKWTHPRPGTRVSSPRVSRVDTDGDIRGRGSAKCQGTDASG